MRKYIPNYLIQKNENHDSIFFLNYNDARCMTSSTIDKGIKKAWKSGGMTSHISSTQIRKSAITSFHSIYSDGLKSKLASHMQHLPSTAAKYYKFFADVEESVTVGKLIRNIFYPKS
jgi:hypothetical protein